MRRLARFVVCVGEDEFEQDEIIYVVWDRKEQVVVGEPQVEQGEADDLCGSLNLMTKRKRRRATV